MNRNAVIKLALTVFSLITVNVLVNAQLPGNYQPGSKVSYIRTWDATAPDTSSSNLITRPLKDVKMTTQYFDGLGRPLETVVKEGSLETASNTKADVVSSSLYDAYGREVYKYLPFVANSAGGNSSINDGNFKFNPFQQQKSFMLAQYSGQVDTFFYSKTELEASPLSRTSKNMAPGNNWVGSNRGVEIKYWTNTTADSVKIFSVTNSGSIGVFATYSVAISSGNGGKYNKGQLAKNVIVDEHGKQKIDFTDKEGRLILKKVQLTASADTGSGENYDGWLCTYYIYDDFNNLRCVIQPEGVKALISNSWQFNSTILNEQCFRYEYDQRNRMVMKKGPGIGETRLIFDQRDRLFMTQDANMRAADKWMITKYDTLNRPIESGIWQDPNGVPFATHHAYAYVNSNYPTISSGYELLTVTHYDDYTNLPAGLSSYLTSWNSHFASTDNTNWPYPQMPQQSSSVKGQITWAKVKILGSSNSFLNTVNYYDSEGRIIQVQSTNIDGGLDILTTQYNWAGNCLVMAQKQQKVSGVAQEHLIVTKSEYDYLGRSTLVKKLVNSVINNVSVNSGEHDLVSFEYDRLGNVKKKKLSPGFNNDAGIENINYEYNIRGWSLGVNRSFVRGEINSNYFGYDLGYDKANNNLIGNAAYLNPQYNGNIEGMVWRSIGDGEKRKYDYYYDASNRLLKADFSQYTSGSFNQSAGLNYNIKMGDGSDAATAYDGNGNIKKMQQWGLKLGGSAQIDSLVYSYISGSNKLSKVNEFASGGTPANTTGFLGDFSEGTNSGNDYNYDLNGNLSLDSNKAISSIIYNHLNLPSVITVAGKGTITYTYDATGGKLKKEVAETGQTVLTLLYLGNTVYEGDDLQSISHEEGRIRITKNSQLEPNGFAFDYMLKDYLGNIRMVLTEEQKTDAYPVASLESASISTESNYYGALNDGRVNKSTVNGYPNDTYTNPNDFIQQLSGSAVKMGANIVLKVMAGDTVNLRANSWYKTNNVDPQSPNLITDLGSVLATALSGISGGKASSSELNSTGLASNAATAFWGAQSGFESNDRPKAYLNWLFLDEQFKYYAGGTNQVGNDQQFKTHLIEDILVNKNGYFYAFISNETPNINVYFDNFQVTHNRGPILEENHYYPFGLVMAGISSQALNGIAQNRLKYNGKEEQREEFSDGSGLNWLDYGARMYDNQIGRWMAPDALADKAQDITPYRYSFNNPIMFIDPDGNWEIIVEEQAKTNKRGKVKGYTYTVTLVAEENDDLTSLHTQSGYTIEELAILKDKTIQKGTTFRAEDLGELFNFKEINRALNMTEEEYLASNCNTGSFAYAEGKKINTDPKEYFFSPLKDAGEADSYLYNNFNSYKTPRTGDIIRYESNDKNLDGFINEIDAQLAAAKNGKSTHFAIFLLENGKGTMVFTKNGTGPYQVLYTHLPSTHPDAEDKRSVNEQYGKPTPYYRDSYPNYRLLK